MQIGFYAFLFFFLFNFTQLNFAILICLYAIKRLTKIVSVLAIRDYIHNNMDKLLLELIKKGGV